MSFYLGWFDYVIFIGVLVLSTLIGIYFGCFGTKQGTTKEYLMGGKNMKAVPIGISVAVSHISGTTLIAMVPDVYRYGASVILMLVCYVIMGFLAIFVYLPVFFNLRTNNIYEYLERRFDKKTRKLAFVIYVMFDVLKFPIYAYTPALTLATVTGINVNFTATILCLVCVFYTAIGGFKTVVWTDFLQFGIIVACLLLIFSIGIDTSSGISSIWRTAEDGERLEIFNFSIDPTARDSFWGHIIGTTLFTISVTVVHQTGVQKFVTLPSFTDCKRAVVYTVFNMCLVQGVNILIGLVVYSRYKDCDPLSSNKIYKHDQLLPFFVADIGSRIPGISGLFVATIASGSLSSMSSNLNALSGVIYKDLVCGFFKKEPSEKYGSKILKIIVLVVGVSCTCLVFAMDKLGEIFSITFMVAGITQGPLLGLFTLGVLFPTANNKGAFYGVIAGFISVASVAIPAKYYQMKGLIKVPTKPLSISGCALTNQTLVSLNSTLSNTNLNQLPEVSWIFRISFFYYAFIGTTMTVIVALVISYMTERNSSVDKIFLTPIVHSCLSKTSQSNNVVPRDGEQELQLLEEKK